MRVEDSQLKAFLIDGGLVSQEQISKAEEKAKKTKQRLEAILVKEKTITQEQLAKLQAYILGIPFVDLSEEIIDRETLQIIPEPIAKRHNIVAFKKQGDERGADAPRFYGLGRIGETRKKRV